jgi:zinc protease
VERAIAAVASTLGAIAQRPQPIINPVLGNGLKFPAGGGATLVVKHKAGKDKAGKDKAALMVGWPAPDRRSDQQKAMDATLLSAVMQNRLIDVIRGKFGAGYAPQSVYDGSWFAPGYGSFVAISDATPEQTPAIFAAIAAMSADLREQPVGKDELDRALQPVIAAAERSLQENAIYGMLLVSPEIETPPMDFLRNQVAMIKAVTPERLQRIAREYLVDAKAVRQVVLPE